MPVTSSCFISWLVLVTVIFLCCICRLRQYIFCMTNTIYLKKELSNNIYLGTDNHSIASCNSAISSRHSSILVTSSSVIKWRTQACSYLWACEWWTFGVSHRQVHNEYRTWEWLCQGQANSQLKECQLEGCSGIGHHIEGWQQGEWEQQQEGQEWQLGEHVGIVEQDPRHSHLDCHEECQLLPWW